LISRRDEEMFTSSGFSEEFLKSWAKQLDYFRYVIAPGGHANDIDELILALQYTGENDLVEILDDLQIQYKRYPEKPPQAEPGKTYTAEEFDKLPPLILGTRWLEQPGWQMMDSVPIFVWCANGTIKISIVGPQEKGWVIGQAEFENAKRLEQHFDRYAGSIIDPPIEVKGCICPKYYPEYWEAGGSGRLNG
jgi:hypothetical protein